MHSNFTCSRCVLPDKIKKSSCNVDTMPKFVYWKILSIIHMILGKTPLFGLNAAMRRGTSPVDWWLTNTRVRESVHCRMSSPASETIIEDENY